MKKNIILKFDTGMLNILLFVIPVASLIFPAILFGYPILHPDTKTYVYSGFANFIPFDRPIGYGWLMKYISFSFSFWLVVIVQSIILVLQVQWVNKHVFRFKEYRAVTAVLLTVLSVISYASLYTSMLMPDIFVVYIILGFWLVIFARDLPLPLKVITFILLAYCNFSHFSNIALSGLLTVLLVIFSLIQKEKKYYRLSLYFVAILVVSLVATKFVNKAVDGTEKLSKGKNIIIMARLIEIGVIQDYLEDYDTEYKYSLTHEIDRLNELNGVADFVWNAESPLFDGDCSEISYKNCWKVKSDEYGEIIKNTLLTPRYAFRVICRYTKDSFRQFFTFQAKNHFHNKPETNIGINVEKHLPADYPYFISAVQMNTNINSSAINSFNKYVFWISLLLSVLIVINRKENRIIFQSFLFILIALLSNAIVCASLSNVVGRYQGRVVWLIPLIVLLYFIGAYRKKVKPEQ
ncbi:MAG: hypothetical protein ACOC2M_03740 [bacterium]